MIEVLEFYDMPTEALNQFAPANNPGWSPDRVETLKALWAEGYSAGQIAVQLGAVTRNAVIGKVHRLGLPGRAVASRKPPRRTMPRRGPGGAMLRGKPAPKPEAVPPLPDPSPAAPALMLPVAKLTAGTCRWPLGDPKRPGFGFCGHRPAHGSPYCAAHKRLGTRPRRKAA
jgi:GcrA cell cycle regulator